MKFIVDDVQAGETKSYIRCLVTSELPHNSFKPYREIVPLEYGQVMEADSIQTGDNCYYIARLLSAIHPTAQWIIEYERLHLDHVYKITCKIDDCRVTRSSQSFDLPMGEGLLHETIYLCLYSIDLYLKHHCKDSLDMATVGMALPQVNG